MSEYSIDEEKLNAYVAEYLKKKGFKRAEQLFNEEAHIQSREDISSQFKASDYMLSNYIMFHNKDESLPTDYDSSYTSFKEWAQSSLDLYKPELMSVLYPLFVHCYLDLVERGYKTEACKFLQKHRIEHPDKLQHEIDRLQMVTKSEHMKNDDFVKIFREHKFNITMCSYSFELLLAYLHERKFMLLLSILNRYLDPKVHPGQPKPRDPETLYTPISGETDIKGTIPQKDKDALSKEINWKLFDEMKKLVPQELFADEEEEEPVPERETKRSKTAEKNQEPEIKKPVSSIQLPGLDERTESEIEEDLRLRAPIGPDQLPSVCFLHILQYLRHTESSVSLQTWKFSCGWIF
eukprot:TRINITY_DN6459_c0_g1_i2.p1 TRINITY_DN6459_c0_g1~~TRINITY_DN6459_c0_g1_i2.p1  ORF type:complete len:350 (-),score=55.58 TRINITY_DN6459_c0_g1_i2:1079-2128(-)